MTAPAHYRIGDLRAEDNLRRIANLRALPDLTSQRELDYLSGAWRPGYIETACEELRAAARQSRMARIWAKVKEALE